MDKDGRYSITYLLGGMISAWLFIWIGVSATDPIRWALLLSWVIYLFFVGVITCVCIFEFRSRWAKKSAEDRERIKTLEKGD